MLSKQSRQGFIKKAKWGQFQSRGNRNGGNRNDPNQPPSFDPALRVTKKLRWVFNPAPGGAVISASVTSDMVIQWLIHAITVVSSACLFQAVRIIKVEVWAAQSQLSATQISAGLLNFKWGATINGIISPVFVNDTSIGVSEPMHISTHPPKDSSVAMMTTGNAQIAFTLNTNNAVASAVVDVTVEGIMANGGAFVAGPVIAGATPGVTYQRSFDGSANWESVGWPQI